MTLRIGSLCTGYGGLDLAVQDVLGGELVWVADPAPGPVAILAHHYPGVPNLGDITRIDWKDVRRNGMADRRRNDQKAEAMYARYRQGLSLAEVAAEFAITRQSVYGMFTGRGWDLHPRPDAKEFVEFQGRRYTIRNNGYYGATSGNRSLLHRDIWEHHNGTIPTGYDIHHLDHDKTNNDISNFECLPKDEHARRYNMGCNGFAHKCGAPAEEVVPSESPAVDILTAGFPRHPARTSATPAAAPESRENAVESGPTSPTPFAWYDPDTCYWRMSQPSLFAGLTESTPTWPRSGTTQRGRAYAHPTLVPRTDATGSSSSRGLLPTPRASDTNGPGQHGAGGLDLRTTVSLLPTPTATPYGNNQSDSPGAAVRPSLNTMASGAHTPQQSPGGNTSPGVELPTPPSPAPAADSACQPDLWSG